MNRRMLLGTMARDLFTSVKVTMLQSLLLRADEEVE
jgi:hypothetical protein